MPKEFKSNRTKSNQSINQSSNQAINQSSNQAIKMFNPEESIREVVDVHGKIIDITFESPDLGNLSVDAGKLKKAMERAMKVAIQSLKNDLEQMDSSPAPGKSSVKELMKNFSPHDEQETRPRVVENKAQPSEGNIQLTTDGLKNLIRDCLSESSTSGKGKTTQAEKKNTWTWWEASSQRYVECQRPTEPKNSSDKTTKVEKKTSGKDKTTIKKTPGPRTLKCRDCGEMVSITCTADWKKHQCTKKTTTGGKKHQSGKKTTTGWKKHQSGKKVKCRMCGEEVDNIVSHLKSKHPHN